MTIKRINEFPEGSGSLSNDDVFLFMDNPAESGITKKISLSQISAAIGGGGGSILNSSGIISPTLLAISGTPNNQTFLRGDSRWVDMVSPANLQLRYGTYSQASGITPLQGEPVWITDKKVLRIGDGETIGGCPIDIRDSDSYVICKPGDSIEDKYLEARNLTPNGQPLSANNRGYFIIMPGKYIWGDPINYTTTVNGFDTEYLDIIGLGSYKLDYGCVPNVIIDTTAFGGSIIVENNINIKGVKTTSGFYFTGGNVIIEDCDLVSSVSSYTEMKFINCNNIEFELSNATYINCLGQFPNPDGKFINCKGGNQSFVHSFGNTSLGAECTNCVGGINSFTNLDATLINCVAGSGSFICNIDGNGEYIPDRTLGKLLYCRLTSGTFAPPSGNGVIRYCINGSLSGVNLP